MGLKKTREGVYPATPELNRMKSVVDDSHKIGEFLDWLDEEKIVLAVYHEHQGSAGDRDDEEPSGCWMKHVCTKSCFCRGPHPHDAGSKGCACRSYSVKVCGYGDDQLASVSISKERLLAKYFKIDLKKVEDERRAILEHLQRKTR